MTTILEMAEQCRRSPVLAELLMLAVRNDELTASERSYASFVGSLDAAGARQVLAAAGAPDDVSADVWTAVALLCDDVAVVCSALAHLPAPVSGPHARTIALGGRLRGTDLLRLPLSLNAEVRATLTSQLAALPPTERWVRAAVAGRCAAGLAFVAQHPLLTAAAASALIVAGAREQAGYDAGRGQARALHDLLDRADLTVVLSSGGSDAVAALDGTVRQLLAQIDGWAVPAAGALVDALFKALLRGSLPTRDGVIGPVVAELLTHRSSGLAELASRPDLPDTAWEHLAGRAWGRRATSGPAGGQQLATVLARNLAVPDAALEALPASCAAAVSRLLEQQQAPAAAFALARALSSTSARAGEVVRTALAAAAPAAAAPAAAAPAAAAPAAAGTDTAAGAA